MNLILTTDEVKFVRRKVDDYKKSAIINTREIMEELGYEGTISDIPVTHHFLINDEIQKKLTDAINSKRINQVIYFHYDINENLIENMKDFFIDEEINDLKLILFDKDESLVKLWTLFDEIKN